MYSINNMNVWDYLAPPNLLQANLHNMSNQLWGKNCDHSEMCSIRPLTDKK